MTAEQLASAVLNLLDTIDGFADHLVDNPDDALRRAELLGCFAAIELTDTSATGSVRGGGRILFTQGWHCVGNTTAYTCHG